MLGQVDHCIRFTAMSEYVAPSRSHAFSSVMESHSQYIRVLIIAGEVNILFLIVYEPLILLQSLIANRSFVIDAAKFPVLTSVELNEVSFHSPTTGEFSEATDFLFKIRMSLYSILAPSAGGFSIFVSRTSKRYIVQGVKSNPLIPE